jgi:hypothetical protein
MDEKDYEKWNKLSEAIDELGLTYEDLPIPKYFNVDPYYADYYKDSDA